METAIHMRKAGHYVPEYSAKSKDFKEPRLAWNPKSEGKPRDWIDQRKTWCKATHNEAKRRWQDTEIEKPNEISFLGAFLESRMDGKGKCVSEFLSNPKERARGWIQFDYTPPKPDYEVFPEQYDKDRKEAKSGHWCQAFHATNLAGMYSILATGIIKESANVENGIRVSPTSLGVFCHGYDPASQKKIKDVRRKADSHLTYWSPLDDGKYYAVKFELQVDRDRGETIRGHQWYQPTESIRIVGLWIKAVTWKDIPMNTWFAEGWNPLKEGNFKKVDCKGERTKTAKSSENNSTEKCEEEEESKEDESEEDGKKDDNIADDARKFDDGELANPDWIEVRRKEWKSHQDKVLDGVSIPYDDDWNWSGVKIQLFSLGYQHMEKESCATAEIPKLTVDHFVKKHLNGDYGKLNFHNIRHQMEIINSVGGNYATQLAGTECIFIDCKRIGEDVEDVDEETMKKSTRHSGWHINNLRANSKQTRFKEIFEEVKEKVQEIRQKKHRADKLTSVVLFCNEGRLSTESVRCGLHGAFMLAGAEIVDSKALCEPAWAQLGCQRCTKCRKPDVSYIRRLWIECFMMLRPDGVGGAVSLLEDDRDEKGDNERSQQKTRSEAVKATGETKKEQQAKKRQAKKDRKKAADKRKSSEAELADETAGKGKKRISEPSPRPSDDQLSECSDDLAQKWPELREEPDEVEEPLPLDVAYKVLQRLLECFRPKANYLQVAFVEHPHPESAIWRIGKDQNIDVAGMIKVAMAEHQGTALKQNLASRSASSEVALLPNRPSESTRRGRSGHRPREKGERRKSRTLLPKRKGEKAKSSS